MTTLRVTFYDGTTATVAGPDPETTANLVQDALDRREGDAEFTNAVRRIKDIVRIDVDL